MSAHSAARLLPLLRFWFSPPEAEKAHRAPDEVLNAYRAVSLRQKNLQLHIFPGVQHGYMMRGMPNAFDHQAREFSMGRAVAILAGFRSGNVQKRLRQAS